MDQVFLQAAQTPLGIFGLFIGCMFILLTFIGKRRSMDLKTLRESNADLRDAIDDNGTLITQLRSEVEDLRNQVLTLQASNTTLQEIVNSALKEYFAENPGVVVQLSKATKVAR